MNRRVAIFTDDPGWHGEHLRRAFAAQGCAARFVSLQACRFDLSDAGAGLTVPGFDPLPEVAFVRGVPGGTLEQVVFYLDVLHALQHLGVTVYNDARAIERSVDKALTSFLLRAAGIPTPPTWIAGDPQFMQQLVEAESRAGHELVLKPLFGSQGNGLARIRSSTQLPALETCHGVYYLQRFICTGIDTACDWRVLVIGGHAAAAMRRCAAGWITNVAQGANLQPALMDDELRELAEAAAGTLEMGYAGVDIMRDEVGRAWVIEVNSIPAWKGLQQVCALDLADRLVTDCLRRGPSGARMEAVG